MSRASRRVTRCPAVGLAMVAPTLGLFSFSEGADEARQKLAGIRRWAVVYGREVDPGKLAGFGLVVVDAEVGREAAELKRSGALILAYLSLGEVHRSRPYFAQAQAAGWLVRENPTWKGSFLVDVRQEGWRRLVVDRLAREILARGFDGLFLDTLDTAETLEREDRVKYGGSVQAMGGLVRALRASYPKALLLPNNAFQVLETIAPAVDGVVAESVFTTYDFTVGRYGRVPEAVRQEKLSRLTEIRRRHRLPVFTIEYAAPEEADLRRDAYAGSRAAGFISYVATIELQEVHAPPESGAQ